ncbi:MAG: recombinase family protein [Gemmatimonadaceae bacterium]|nr:recombinase family protein [Gemmatimonadaceae bacterium]
MAVELGRVVGYARVSTYDQGERYGLTIQRQAIKEYCARWSLELGTIHEDEVSSQLDENRRPGLRALVDEAKAGRISLWGPIYYSK